MNGKAAALDRWLEAIRQRALTNSLGQVACAWDRHPIMDGPDGYVCWKCKAAV